VIAAPKRGQAAISPRRLEELGQQYVRELAALEAQLMVGISAFIRLASSSRCISIRFYLESRFYFNRRPAPIPARTLSLAANRQRRTPSHSSSAKRKTLGWLDCSNTTLSLGRIVKAKVLVPRSQFEILTSSKVHIASRYRMESLAVEDMPNREALRCGTFSVWIEL